MKHPVLCIAIVISVMLAACDRATETSTADPSIDLAPVVKLVATLNEGIETEYTFGAQAQDGIPVIRVEVQDPGSDYESLVPLVAASEEVQAFEGALYLSFEHQTEPPDMDQDPPFLGAKQILGTFDAKSGDRRR